MFLSSNGNEGNNIDLVASNITSLIHKKTAFLIKKCNPSPAIAVKY